MNLCIALCCGILLSIISTCQILAQPPAFPGAEGYGCQTSHARGRAVFHVTRLDDEDKMQEVKYLKPGQFRYALARASVSGGGYIVFDVAGTIQLKRAALIPSNTYIAGQSAPGGGIAIEGGKLAIGSLKDRPTHDVLVRHLRYRGRSPRGSDAFNIAGAGTKNIVLDHVSVSFFQDGAVDITEGATDVTLQWCHFGDASDSGTSEHYHGEPHLIAKGANRVSIHHNLYTHVHSRAPWVTNETREDECRIEFSNNVIYDYRKYPSRFQAPKGVANVVGNLYVPGAFTHGDGSGQRPVVIGDNAFRVFLQDNLALSGLGHDNKRPDGKVFKGNDQHVQRGNPAIIVGCRQTATQPETDLMGDGKQRGSIPGVFEFATKRFDTLPAITYAPVKENLNEVCRCFGALPRDHTDRRILTELLTNSGGWKLEIPLDVNEYAGTPREDADGDGMADAWEKQQGLNLNANGRDLNRHYDNIEVYLTYLADSLTKHRPAVDASVVIDRASKLGFIAPQD
jgi:Pectate lyase